MSIKQQRRSSLTRNLLTINGPSIKSKMNLQKVAEAINKDNGLLSTDQENLLWQRYTPEEDRKSQLLEFISQKGEEGMERFVECLRSSGHSALADELEGQMSTEWPNTWPHNLCNVVVIHLSFCLVQSLVLIINIG